MYLQTVFMLSIVALSQGVDKTRLWRTPPPMKGFLLNPSLGRWFIQFRSAPCGWEGSSEFRDYETTLIMDGQNIIARETMRNDVCNTVTSNLYLRSPPGVFTVKDQLGNNWSGSYVIPATDYKTFSITYGCTKVSTMGDKCDDPWLSVKTRMPNPGPKVVAMINDALMSLWGITVDHLQQVQHQQSCLTKKGPHLPFPEPFMGSGPPAVVY
ncbi:hypothetical protein ACF0H5_017182 [Mactra antiquata]